MRFDFTRIGSPDSADRSDCILIDAIQSFYKKINIIIIRLPVDLDTKLTIREIYNFPKKFVPSMALWGL